MRAALAGIGLIAALAGGVALLGDGAEPAPVGPATAAAAPPAAPAARARSAAAPTRGAGVFGLNEGVTIPEPLLVRGVVPPDQEVGMLERAARDAAAVGVGVVRANSAVYPFFSQYGQERLGQDWRRPDAWMQAVQAQGIEPHVVLGPWPGTRTASYTDTYLPGDMAAYTAYVKRVVERYDGDGVDDMPGLRAGVRSWEVDNEPDLHNSAPPRDAKVKVDPSKFQTPKEYATLLVATAGAIREADSDAVVLIAGIYRGATDQGRRYLKEVLAQPGATEAFDVLSLHCYFELDNLDTIDGCVETARTIAPDKPFWITETGVPGDGRKPWADEAWQARMVAAVFGGFLGAGAERVFWHTLSDPPSSAMPGGNRQHPFASHALYRSVAAADGHPAVSASREMKPSGQVYQRISGLLREADPATFVEVKARGGRLLGAGTGWLAYAGSPEAPAGARTAQDLLTGQTREIKPGEAVQAPAWIQ